MGVAVLGVGTTLLLARVAPVFASLEGKSPLVAWALLFLLVGAVPILMGGTLPAMVRSLQISSSRIGYGGGRMYAANTTGAILGALGSSFWLIPAFGIQGTALAAAAMGMIGAAGALWLNRSAPFVKEAKASTPFAPPGKSAPAAMLAYAAAGGLALGYEVVWSQAVVPFMSTRSFAFSVMLATYLWGLALGAALFARRADRVRDPWGAFGLLISFAGLIALLEISLLGRWLPTLQSFAEHAALSMTSSALAGMCARFFVAALVLVFVPTLFLGAAFPAALRHSVQAGHEGRDVGKVVALNTLGGIAGTILTGFLLVPRFGLVTTLAILAVLAAVLGCAAAFRSTEGGWKGARGATAAALVTAGLAAFLTPGDRMAALLAGSRGGAIVYYKEGQGGTVAVLEQAAGTKKFRRLYIQGVSNTGDSLPSQRYMRLQALLPLLIHNSDPKAALVIGLGTGITAGALLTFPGLEHRVVAELLPEVRAAASSFRGNFDAMSDPRLDIRLRDGRRELLRHAQTYDLITLEPPPPSAAGVVNLYSRDFYELARRRLRPAGIVAQWLPLPTQNDAETRSLVRSFLDVFPHASLWTTEIHEMLLLGSMEPVLLDAKRISGRFFEPHVAAALNEVGISSPAALLATWITDHAGLANYAGKALPVTDDKPRIEYADWVRRDELQRVLPSLLELRTNPPVLGADETFLKNLASERQRLLLFYQAALNAQAGHATLWAEDMRRVLAGDGGNPYYRWFTAITPDDTKPAPATGYNSSKSAGTTAP